MVQADAVPEPLADVGAVRTGEREAGNTRRDQWGSTSPTATMSDIVSDMKTVTLRSLRRQTALLEAAADGEEILVTRFGTPYVRIIPAKKPRSFLGAGKHLGQKEAVSSDPIRVSEWKGLD